jgi:Protein of unknown function (DUF2442)
LPKTYPEYCLIDPGFSPSAAPKATERNQVEISRLGLHWEAIDEDISIAGLIAGRGDVTQTPESAA